MKLATKTAACTRPFFKLGRDSISIHFVSQQKPTELQLIPSWVAQTYGSAVYDVYKRITTSK